MEQSSKYKGGPMFCKQGLFIAEDLTVWEKLRSDYGSWSMERAELWIEAPRILSKNSAMCNFTLPIYDDDLHSRQRNITQYDHKYTL